jgi:predicted O-methyltransferase YrrM
MCFPIDIVVEGEVTIYYLEVGSDGPAVAAAKLCNVITCDPGSDMTHNTVETVELWVSSFLEHSHKGFFVNWVIEDMYRNNMLRNGGKVLTSSLPPDAGMVLYNVIRQHKDVIRNTLEVGLAYGISTLYICQAHKDNGRLDNKSHLAVDPLQSTVWHDIGMLNVERAGLAHLMTHLELADHFFLPLAQKRGERFQFAFIDGLHVFDYAILDAFYIDLMLDVGGFVAFDDADIPGITQAVNYFSTNRAYQEVTEEDIGLETLELLRTTRMKMLRKLSDDDRQWDHHIDF